MLPTDDVSVQMTAAEWNQVITILAEGPFRVVAPLIVKIQNHFRPDGAAPLPTAADGEARRDVSH
jgi:hypothetical protein